MAIYFTLLLILCSISVVAGNPGGVSKQALCGIVNDCLPRLDRGQTCPILPIPSEAFVRTVPPGSFAFDTVRSGVHVYDDGVYRSMMILSERRLVLVDLPDAPSSNIPTGSMTLLTAAAEQILNGTIPEQIDIVYSHAHLDHIGGTVRVVKFAREAYPGVKIEIWGTRETIELVRNSVTNRALTPTKIIGRRNRKLKLRDGLELNFQIVGGHTAQDLLIFIPKYEEEPSILMYVDILIPKWAPAVNFANSENLFRYMAVQREILRHEFDVLVPGHFCLGTREDVANNLQYTRDVVEAAGRALELVTPEVLVQNGLGLISDPNALEFGNIWYLALEVVQGAQIDACFRIILEKWGCKLAAVDVVLRSHCSTALFFRSLDL